jgi:hypothetical protein
MFTEKAPGRPGRVDFFPEAGECDRSSPPSLSEAVLFPDMPGEPESSGLPVPLPHPDPSIKLASKNKRQKITFFMIMALTKIPPIFTQHKSARQRLWEEIVASPVKVCQGRDSRPSNRAA